MKISIAGMALTAVRPETLDNQVAAATGCSVDELAASIAREPAPIMLTALLHPCLSGADAPSKPRLSEMLASALADDTAGTVKEVLRVVAGDGKPKRSAD